jgi:transcription elongation factor Elf1
MEYYKNKVAWCPICNQGWVEIYKDKKYKNLFVSCDECESMWEHPNEISNVDLAILTFETEIEISHPTEDDILKKGWDKYILNS